MEKKTKTDEIKVIRRSYSGKGRPKNSDYIKVRIEQIHGRNSIRGRL